MWPPDAADVAGLVGFATQNFQWSQKADAGIFGSGLEFVGQTPHESGGPVGEILDPQKSRFDWSLTPGRLVTPLLGTQ